MHIVFAHAGLHRVQRGSEVAFEAIAHEIALQGRHEVTLLGSGQPIDGRAYAFRHIAFIGREKFTRWPNVPLLRNADMYEELTFAACLALTNADSRADVIICCGYPYSNWVARRPRLRGRRPKHIFVTQNGDWAASSSPGEPKLFSCDGLVCTNPTYFERNAGRWPSILIPNGLDPVRYHPGEGDRERFGLPGDKPVVLMASALQANKGVLEAIRAVSQVPEAYLFVAGDGELRSEVDRLGQQLLGGRFQRKLVANNAMPELYRSADMLLHMTVGESFGNIYIEALRSGIPIIANDESTTRWILGDHGHFIDTTSENEVVAALASHIAEKGSQRHQAARWAKETYSWRDIASRYISFIEKVGSVT